MKMNGVEDALSVLLVDDHPVVRDGLRAMLGRSPGIEVVGEAASGEEALEKVTQLSPDVVLMDVRMPGMGGIEATRQIKAACPSAATIVFTMYDSEMYVVQALRAGAAGYLAKDCSADLLVHAIKAVVDGATMVRSGLLHQVMRGHLRPPQQPVGRPSDPGAGEGFTPREVDVLRLVALGHANRQVARELNLAEVTVKKHVQSIIGKMGVADRTHAAVLAVRMGLVE